MEILFPRPREKRKQIRSQSTPVRMNSIADGFGEKIEEIPRHENLESDPKVQPQGGETTYTRQFGKKTYSQSRLPDDWSNLEPDERGAELAREARVWKVYVEETDKWDQERVDGWDKSMDVLLVFAALFSAISGAFLIETSKLLKEDPADVTAAALRAISHVLVNTTANSSTGGPPLPPAEGSFTPPKIAVIVNTLWYMSLSLSIATAFLAMLAKDWCYSFLAHRTGHPRDQAHRRQRKWKLIERWKMEELIIVLPSLMHLSLLLFAIGLCIYLWDLNSTIAIPVMCIAGIFLAFYIWSSLTASIVEDFPYTTIVSRILRSKYMRILKDTLIVLLCAIFILAMLVVGAIYFIYFCVLMIVFVGINLLPWPFLVPTWFALGCMGRTDDPATKLYFSFVDTTFNLTMRLAFVPFQLVSSIYYRVEDITKKFALPEDLITSLALSWLIQHCETPSSVDIALQAIAGATQRIPKDPLLASRAIEQIMRRIVSHDPHDEAKSKNSLYIRGLEILRLNSSSASQGAKQGITGDLEVMVWDLKSKNEHEITELIKDGSFVPSDHNLAAMRIGNSAASQSLGLLRGEARGTRQSLCSITKLLFRHFETEDEQLHPAALQSLANAAALHIALSASPELPPGLIDLFMRHCEHLVQQDDQSPRKIPAVALFIVCVLLHGNPNGGGGKTSDPTQSINQLHAHARHAIRLLVDINVEGAGFRNRIFWISCLEVISNPAKYGLEQGVNAWTSLKQSCSERVAKHVRKRGFPFVSSWDPDTKSVTSARNKLLRGISQIYELIEVSRSHESGPTQLPAQLHTILTMITCGNLLDKRQSQTCNELLAKLSFPIVNEAFIDCLELPTNENDQTNLSALGATYTNNEQVQGRRHFAATQLWLLIYLTSDSSSKDQQTLRTNMESALKESLQLESKGFDQVKQELEEFIIEGYRNAHRTISSDKEVDDEKRSPSMWEKIKSPSLKWWTGNNAQGSSLRNGSGLNRIKSTLGMEIEEPYTMDKHHRMYTARIVQLMLHTHEPQDNNEELASLIQVDFEHLPPYLQDLSAIPALPAPSSLTARDRALMLTEDTQSSHTMMEPETYDVEHVAVAIYDPPSKFSSVDHDSDLGIEAQFNESSEALLSRIA